MNDDDLKHVLSAWEAPPIPLSARERVGVLLRDAPTPGPVVSRGIRAAIVPFAYAAVVALLVLSMATGYDGRGPVLTQHQIAISTPPVTSPAMPADAQLTATAVSVVNLHGYEPVPNPRIRVHRREP